MATTTIPWGDGSGGNIYLTYPSASGDQEVLVSSDANTGSARTKTVTFTSAVGSITRMLTVSQEAGGPQEYTISLHPTSYDTENYSWRTSSNISNGYTNSTSTTYARIGIPKPYGEAYVYFKFDTSSIPDGAEIVSVECKAKAAASGNSTTTPTKLIQMATGTTLKGTATTITSTATERTLDVGEWTLAELRDIRIRPYAKTGNTQSNYNLDFYGATLTVTYTVNPTISADFLLSSYDSTDKSYYSLTSVSNAYTDVDSDTVCGINMKRGEGAETWIYFKFDTSTIPANATIKSVVCQANLGKQSANTDYIASAYAVLCSGTVAKGDPIALNASARVETFQDVGWTRSELNDIRIKIYGTRGTLNTSNSYSLRIYGAKLTVNYTV